MVGKLKTPGGVLLAREQESVVDDATLRIAKFACGSCCVAECRILKAAMIAVKQGEELTKGNNDGEFVVVECSNGQCKMQQMHSECYEHVFDSLQQVLGHTWATGSAKLKRDASTRKAAGGNMPPHQIWRGANYDTQLRHLCRCACGNGFFRACLDKQEVGDPLKAATEDVPLTTHVPLPLPHDP